MLRVSPYCPSKRLLRASGQSKAYVDNGDNRQSCPYPFPFDALRGVSVPSRVRQVIEKPQADPLPGDARAKVIGTASDETGMSGTFCEGIIGNKLSFAQDR